MSIIAWAVFVSVLASPNPAIADGNCAAITGTGEIQPISFPNWPSDEPVASLTGTASLQIGGGQALSLSITGEVSDMVIPAEDDFDASPTAMVSVIFSLAGVGGFEGVGEVVVTLPETTDLDGVFAIAATLTISGGTGDFKGVSGTVVCGGQNDFFSGVGTLELSGEICLRTVCHVPPGEPENAHTIRIGAAAVSAHLEHGDYLGPCVDGGGAPAAKRVQDETDAPGTGNVPCGAFSPALLLLGLVGMRLMRQRVSANRTRRQRAS